MVLESTTRQATDLGYCVAVADDACTAGSEAQHAASLAAQATFADILSDAGNRRLVPHVSFHDSLVQVYNELSEFALGRTK